QGSTTGSGKLILNLRNLHMAGSFSGALGTVNGKNVALNIDQPTLNNLSSGFMNFPATSTVEINVGAVNYNGQSLFWSGQPVPTTGSITVRGLNARVDITKISRVDGACVFNTNAAANNGTDGVIPAGLYFCTGTAVGSWKLAGTTGGANKQY
ncbi:hypothetical protein WDZ92_35140, partial [Nostoc sp. NIES-2111]